MTEKIVLKKCSLRNSEIEEIVKKSITIEILNSENQSLTIEKELLERIVNEMKLEYCFRANIKTSKGDWDWDLDKCIMNYCNHDTCNGKIIIGNGLYVDNKVVIPVFPKKTVDWFLDFWNYDKIEKNKSINYYQLDYEITLNPFYTSKIDTVDIDYRISFN